MTIKNWKNFLVCMILAGVFLVPATTFAGSAQGSKEISLYGGKSGNILFPHHVHQAVVKDCMVCHADFAQKKGALGNAKKTGDLKRKQVMNKTCLKCHRALKKAGEKAGPTSCKKCHIK